MSGPVKVTKYRRLTSPMYNKTVTLEQRIADLEKKKSEVENKIARMKEIKHVFDTLPFKEGDVAFHPDYGNVIIKAIQYGPAESDFEDIKYNVVTLNGTVSKSYKEFVEISEATKVLFGKKDERNKPN